LAQVRTSRLGLLFSQCHRDVETLWPSVRFFIFRESLGQKLRPGHPFFSVSHENVTRSVAGITLCFGHVGIGFVELIPDFRRCFDR
jgi:hypothetical protein